MFEVMHQPRLQSFENQSIRPLGLSIRLRMSDRSVVDSRALGGTKGFEFFRIEVRAIIHDDAVRDAISEYKFSDEANNSTGVKVLDWFSLNPLGELVDCHQYMREATSPCSQRTDHVQPPYCERPDEWNGLQG